MNSEPEEKDTQETRYYLIFNELTKISHEDAALARDIDDIETVSRMIVDVNDEDQPRFMTST